MKRICHSCGARFYDMRRNPATCPKCGTEFDPEAALKSRRSRPAGVVAAQEVDAPEADVVEEDGVAVEAGEKAEEDEELIEDTSELGEDEDDVADVIENVDDEEDR